jgi:alpha-L-fucosidase
MEMPAWWGERRLGLFVHANLATVPAWAPIGQYAEWYRCHLGEPVADTFLMPTALPETLAHHRERWGHIERYDDFAPLLTFDRFDGEELARLAVDAGAGYTIFVAKHHDGWTWWDAPNSTHRFTEAGPKRNVLAEYAAACERNDIVFGTYYSLLDWADDRYPSPDYVEQVVHAHVVDLVERYGSQVLWGDGHWGHGPETWRTDELLARVREVAPEVLVNDRWWADRGDGDVDAPSIVRTFEYDTPDDITAGPWELCRGIGSSFGHNRTERAEHHLSGFDIVALFTEVVAKGGHLLLNVGPAADGTVPDLQSGPVRDAGTWIRLHDEVIARSEPWVRWGDDDVRFLSVDGVLHAVDVSGTGLVRGIDPSEHRVLSVDQLDGADEVDIAFTHDDNGLRLHDRPHSSSSDAVGVAVYRVELEAVDRPVELFDSTVASIPAAPTPLGPLVENARPGDIVQLSDGRYTGPAVVPPGVVLRGLGPDRTTIVAAPMSVDADAPIVRLERSARAEHLRIEGREGRSVWFAEPAVALTGQFSSLLGCDIVGRGSVEADDVLVRACSLRGVDAAHVERLVVSRCMLVGNRWDVGVHITGGAQHEIDSCDIVDHLQAVRLTDCASTTVRGNTVSARWAGVALERTEGAQVSGNRIRATMRAVDVDGGRGAIVEGNAVTDGDSGCVIRGGASDCWVSGNRWEGCRVGLMLWEVDRVEHHDNHAIDPDDAELLVGP